MRIEYRTEVRKDVDIISAMAHNNGVQFIPQPVGVETTRTLFHHGDHGYLSTIWYEHRHNRDACVLGLFFYGSGLLLELFQAPLSLCAWFTFQKSNLIVRTYH